MTMKLGFFGRSSFVVYVIAALVGAAVLVFYLHHRSIAMFSHQTELVFQKVSEVTGERLLGQIRNTLDGPVLDTLWAPESKFGRLGTLVQSGRTDVLARQYAEGLAKYPQIERFFLLTPSNDRPAGASETLFFGGRTPESADAFYRDPLLGREVAELARQYEGSGQSYVGAERRIGNTTYVIFMRRFWRDGALDDRVFALLGFVVNLDAVRATLFENLHRVWLRQLLEPADGSPPLEMRVLDDAGHQVFGPPGQPPSTARSMQFALRFYPRDVERRTASTIPVRLWTLTVNPPPESLPAQVRATATVVYWLSGLSASLMLVALLFAVKGIRQVLELSRMQSDFVAHVSHQLKTPLSLLSAASETLSLGRSRSAEKTSEYLAIIRSETASLSGLVDRILEFSRHDGQRRVYAFEPVDLVTLVRECVEGFLRARPESDIAISFVQDDVGELPMIKADAAALEQVLLNLLDNAVRYSHGTSDITVRIRQVRSEAVLEVVDKGIGIGTADAKRIFERFYRGEGAPLNRHGFGLGLAIARQIVDAHHGTIEVESTPGQGSTFRVRLPFPAGAGARWSIPLRTWLQSLRTMRTS